MRDLLILLVGVDGQLTWTAAFIRLEVTEADPLQAGRVENRRHGFAERLKHPVDGELLVSPVIR